MTNEMAADAERNKDEISEIEKRRMLDELNDFRKGLMSYKERQEKFGRIIFTEGQKKKLDELRSKLVRKYHWQKETISEYGGRPYMKVRGVNYDVFIYSLSSLHIIPDQFTALDRAINLVNKAIQKIESTPVSSIELRVVSTTQGLIEIDEELSQLFDKMHFHPKVVEVSGSLFRTGHYAQAIFEAFKAVNNFVKEKSRLPPNEVRRMKDKQLMAKVFDENNPIIKLNELLTDTERNEQEGFKLLFMGATVGIRNPKAHESVVQKDPYITLEYLGFASFLLKRIDYWEAGIS